MANKTFKYFKLSEFADKISGANKISPTLVKMLDKARGLAGVPFVILSGYRDETHPESIKNPNSSHILGLAVDIVVTPDNKDIIFNALYDAGFRRFGFNNGTIHVDIDTQRTQDVAWFYGRHETVYSFDNNDYMNGLRYA